MMHKWLGSARRDSLIPLRPYGHGVIPPSLQPSPPKQAFAFDATNEAAHVVGVGAGRGLQREGAAAAMAHRTGAQHAKASSCFAAAQQGAEADSLANCSCQPIFLCFIQHLGVVTQLQPHSHTWTPLLVTYTGFSPFLSHTSNPKLHTPSTPPSQTHQAEQLIGL